MDIKEIINMVNKYKNPMEDYLNELASYNPSQYIKPLDLEMEQPTSLLPMLFRLKQMAKRQGNLPKPAVMPKVSPVGLKGKLSLIEESVVEEQSPYEKMVEENRRLANEQAIKLKQEQETERLRKIEEQKAQQQADRQKLADELREKQHLAEVEKERLKIEQEYADKQKQLDLQKTENEAIQLRKQQAEEEQKRIKIAKQNEYEQELQLRQIEKDKAIAEKNRLIQERNDRFEEIKQQKELSQEQKALDRLKAKQDYQKAEDERKLALEETKRAKQEKLKLAKQQREEEYLAKKEYKVGSVAKLPDGRKYVITSLIDPNKPATEDNITAEEYDVYKQKQKDLQRSEYANRRQIYEEAEAQKRAEREYNLAKRKEYIKTLKTEQKQEQLEIKYKVKEETQARKEQMQREKERQNARLEEAKRRKEEQQARIEEEQNRRKELIKQQKVERQERMSRLREKQKTVRYGNIIYSKGEVVTYWGRKYRIIGKKDPNLPLNWGNAEVEELEG